MIQISVANSIHLFDYKIIGQQYYYSIRLPKKVNHSSRKDIKIFISIQICVSKSTKYVLSEKYEIRVDFFGLEDLDTTTT